MNSSTIELIVNGLAGAPWLTPARVTAYSRILLVMMIALAAVWIGASHRGLDQLGKPLGTDFLSFWTVSKLTLSGHADLAYDVAAHQAIQRASFPGSRLGYEAFFYPPTYLLVCMPLGLASYGLALAAWLAAGGYVCWRALRALVAPVAASLTVVMLSYPGILTNIGHGQNAFLTTALFAGGGLLMDKRRVLAGALLGLLIIKPHLGLLLPVGLLAAWRWRSILGAAMSVVALAALSTLAFGPVIWLDYLKVTPLAGKALTQGWVPMADMQSVFAAVRLLHGGLTLAWSLQALTAIVACGGLVWAVRRRPLDGPALISLIVSATLLTTPFLLDYDLMLSAIPLAWIAREALTGGGFLRWEKIVILSTFILPLVSRTFAGFVHLPIGPFVLMALFAVIVRRAAGGDGASGPNIGATSTEVGRGPVWSSGACPEAAPKSEHRPFGPDFRRRLASPEMTSRLSSSVSFPDGGLWARP